MQTQILQQIEQWENELKQVEDAEKATLIRQRLEQVWDGMGALWIGVKS